LNPNSESQGSEPEPLEQDLNSKGEEQMNPFVSALNTYHAG
jgi:hypothetical protein